jgi:hypothetical protein
LDFLGVSRVTGISEFLEFLWNSGEFSNFGISGIFLGFFLEFGILRILLLRIPEIPGEFSRILEFLGFSFRIFIIYSY